MIAGPLRNHHPFRLHTKWNVPFRGRNTIKLARYGYIPLLLFVVATLSSLVVFTDYVYFSDFNGFDGMRYWIRTGIEKSLHTIYWRNRLYYRPFTLYCLHALL